MRNSKAFIPSCVLIAGSLMLGSVSNAAASDFLGVFCWNISASDGTGTLKLAITDMGGSHFIVNGVIGDASRLDPINGNAEILGGKVMLNMRSAYLDDIENGAGASSWSMSLDLSTLSGSFKAFFQDYYGGFEPLNYEEGAVNSVACP